MPIPVPAPEHFQIVNAHEDRIQRIESSMQEITSSVTEIKVKQEFLSEKLDNNHKQVIDTLEKFSNTVWSKIDSSKKEVEEQDDRLQLLEFKVKSSGKRRNTIKKVAVPVLIAACGGILTKMGQILLKGMGM